MFFARIQLRFSLGKGYVLAFFSLLLSFSWSCASRTVDMESPSLGRPAGSAAGDSSGNSGNQLDVMGNEHWLRFSYGVLQGSYTDDQKNLTNSRTKKIENLKLNGERYSLEAYPYVPSFPGSQHAYTYLDFRNEKPQTEYWTKRQSALAVFGYVLDNFRLIAPVIGVHWEFNKIDIGNDESPEVAKSDVRATIVGLHYRQNFLSPGSGFAMYHKGKLHLLNLGFSSRGYEADLGLGATLKIGSLEGGLELGYLYQNFLGETAASADDTRKLKVSSVSGSAYAMIVVWL